jgi:F0F1-type ATP synthase assembly protein I
VVTERDDKSWLRLAGLGFELAASIAGGVLIGWWIDRRLGTSPKATVGLGLIGLFGGMYNLIKTALRSGDR